MVQKDPEVFQNGCHRFGGCTVDVERAPSRHMVNEHAKASYNTPMCFTIFLAIEIAIVIAKIFVVDIQCDCKADRL